MINRQGYTLIEIIIYMALFSFVIGGFLLTTYSIIESSGHLQSRAIIDEEGTFLLRKIDWALNGATQVVIPCTNTLTITNPTLPPLENPLLFTFSSPNITLARGGGSPVRVNSDSIAVTNLLFTCTAPSAGKPAKVQALFTLSSLGRSLEFDSTKYLRQ
ncbi:MAG: hypothetical protein G01um101420_450 [Parcubacteria group bacterium Gr01-1014_20]|nr:MAG: hypothetical protein G01um101420_450 [Parcubacteria group bacterium Gr01-1014_20]